MLRMMPNCENDYVVEKNKKRNLLPLTLISIQMIQIDGPVSYHTIPPISFAGGKKWFVNYS